MFQRVATFLSAVEPGDSQQRRWEQLFYRVMANLEFHPSSRVLANAGTSVSQLQNCFVFPLEDSQKQILEILAESSVIKGLGGGCGFNYSNIRPRGDSVRGTPGLAAGPVPMMEFFDLASSTFRQQGRYESGNMAVLSASHPDVFDFIAAKQVDGRFSRTNLSLAVTDQFMAAASSNEPWPLINPRTQQLVRRVSARSVFEAACKGAANTGDPGLLFLDRINADNPLRASLGDIVATNPCGEIGLYPYESCNLGYLNLTKFLRPPQCRTPRVLFDFDRLSAVIAVAVRMIDNAISASAYPTAKLRDAAIANRRIGLGVTGWADCLAPLWHPIRFRTSRRRCRSTWRELFGRRR